MNIEDVQLHVLVHPYINQQVANVLAILDLQIGFDILVKDNPDSTEWICYDTITDEVKLSSYNLEQTMFDILNRVVKKYGLSYTDCKFEVVNGKMIKSE